MHSYNTYHIATPKEFIFQDRESRRKRGRMLQGKRRDRGFAGGLDTCMRKAVV